jgi:hypothetical protein
MAKKQNKKVKLIWECETLEDRVQAIQELINNGSVWHMEGSLGREAMGYLKDGLCELGEKSFRDYWGNRVPSRFEVQAGTTGAPLSTRV